MREGNKQQKNIVIIAKTFHIQCTHTHNRNNEKRSQHTLVVNIAHIYFWLLFFHWNKIRRIKTNYSGFHFAVLCCAVCLPQLNIVVTRIQKQYTRRTEFKTLYKRVFSVVNCCFVCISSVCMHVCVWVQCSSLRPNCCALPLFGVSNNNTIRLK